MHMLLYMAKETVCVIIKDLEVRRLSQIIQVDSSVSKWVLLREAVISERQQWAVAWSETLVPGPEIEPGQPGWKAES